MTTKDKGYGIAAYAKRGSSAFNINDNSTSTLTTHAAWLAFAMRAPMAAEIWLKQLRAVDEDATRNVLNNVPPERLTEIGKVFTFRLLRENQTRLLEER